jgi:Flp pilus assembly protein TadD
MGVEYQKLGQHEQAIRNFNTATQLNPNQPVFHVNKSYSYYSLGQIQQARAAAQKALNLGGNIQRSYLQKIGLQ